MEFSLQPCWSSASVERQSKRKTILCLYKDIIEFIFTYLNTEKHHLKTLPLVCKFFKKCADNNISWSKIITLYNNTPLSILDRVKFKGATISNIRDDKKISGIIKKLQSVEIISFCNCYFNNNHIRELSKLENLKDLKILHCDRGFVSLDLILKNEKLENLKAYGYFFQQNDLYNISTYPFKKLQIRGGNYNQNYLEFLNTQHLTAMYIDCVTSKYLNGFFSRLGKCESLKKLRLRIPSIINFDNLLVSISQLKLKKIYITEMNTEGETIENDVIVKYINPIELEELTFINLNMIFCNDDLIKLLDNAHQLKKLKIYQRNITLNIGFIFSKINQLSNLYRIDINRVNITDDEMKHLNKFNLRYLSIQNCNISNKGLERIKNLKLYHLNITGCNVTDKGLYNLKNMKLTILVLDGNKIKGPGLNHLKKLPLVYLDLSNTCIDSTYLYHISNLELHELYLEGCKNITNNCILFLENMPLQKLCLPYNISIDKSHPLYKVLII
jgi:hypothetical protein